MSKKIIIIGPPNAGKTTLRKVFFEGENPTALLENALDPTHGIESIILKLSEEIGIFDLAGQENEFWLEINKNSIFFDSEIIIIVLDITNPIEDIFNFTEIVLNIRNELTPSSIVYLLLHKIDLIDNDRLKEIRTQVDNKLFKENLLKIAYTSIKKESFQKTFGLFIDILKTCISKKVATKTIDLNFYRDTIYFLYKLQEKYPISKVELQDELKYSNQTIGHIIDILVKH
jgi:GTPase SAR1 family protein